MNRDKISDKVKSNKRYLNNEDLLESFVDLAIERLNGFDDVISDNDALERYIDKVVSKSIIDVLKQNDRYNKPRKEHSSKVDYKLFNYDNEKFVHKQFTLSKLKQLYSMLKNSDNNNDTSFLDVIIFRYKEKQNLKNLIETMEISQEEVVEILFDMSDYADKVAKI